MRKEEYRIGRKTGSPTLLVKQAPGWKVVFRCERFREAADWLSARGVAAEDVIVVDQWPWRSLAETLKLSEGHDHL